MPSRKSKRRPKTMEQEEDITGTSTAHVPLPRQQIFKGDSSWEAFIKVFLSLAVTCGWGEEERRVRLLSSLAGEAADYIFRTQPESVVASFSSLQDALANRFAERANPTSFVSKLEARKLLPTESIAEYIADLQKFVLRGFPTADEATREQIALRQFFRGLPDQNIAMSVGMQEPANLAEAQTLVERYRSIRAEHQQPHRLRPVTTDQDVDKKLASLEARLQASFNAKIDSLVDRLSEVTVAGGRGRGEHFQRGRGRGAGNRGRGRGRGRGGWTCYICGEEGHLQYHCPLQRVQPPQQEN